MIGTTPCRARGFTLVELMIAIVVSGILAAMAAPSFTSMIRQHRVANATNDLVGVFALARSEAARRGHPVTACVSTDASTCSTSAHWSGGWLVFADYNGDGALDPGEEVLRVGGPLGAAVTAEGNGGVSRSVSYRADGRSGLPGGGLQMGTITLSAGAHTRELILSGTGRVRVAAPAGG